MLTLQLVPYSEIESLTSVGRIRKLLNIVKEEKIVLLQGRLSKDEETELIRTTMEEVNKEFKGIELSVIYPNKKKNGQQKNNFFNDVKTNLVNFLLGDRNGLTVIGPASVVKEIKKSPDKIQLYTANSRKRRKRNSR